jgi:predicted metal-binding membrane protein
VSIGAALIRSGSPRPASAGSSPTRPATRFASGPVTAAFLGAWVLLALGEVSGVNGHVRHHAVAEGTMPPGVGLGVFLVGWLVMVAAMMLPATRPALARLPRQSGPAGHGLQGRFLTGFALVWAGAGVAALALDTLVHEAVEGTPALGARPALVGATLLALAGTLQLAPLTRAGVAASEAGSALLAGTQDGVRCLRSDGPLMLVMFGLGSNLAAMALLTGLMAAQRSPRWGRQVVAAIGALLLAGAALVAYDPPWLPSLFGVR